MKRAISLLLLPATLMAQPAAAPPDIPAPKQSALRPVVEYSLNSNPEVQTAWDRFLAAMDATDVARGEYLPNVDLSLRGGVGRQDFIDQSNEVDFTPRGASLTITQMLYDGWATPSQVNLQQEEARARYFDLMAQIETTALEVVTAYQDVRRFRGLVELARKNLQEHQRVLEQIRERVDAGVSRAADLDQATARLALAESNLITEQNNLHDVSARFQRVVGLAPPVNLSSIEDALSFRAPTDIVKALSAANAENPTLLSAVASIHAAKYNVKRNQARHLPRLDLQLSGDYGEDIQRIQGRTSDTSAELVVSWNLFNGLADRAAVSQAVNEVSVASDIRETRCRNVRQTVRIAHNDLARLADQKRFLSVQQQSTDKARAAYLSQFRLGQRSLLDLLDSQNEYFQTSRSVLENQVNLETAQARTLAGMGQLARALTLIKTDVPPREDWLSEDLGPSLCPGADSVGYNIFDSDSDGVPDNRDACPDTAPGSRVDAAGCRQEAVLDSDGDGVVDGSDLCPNTPAGAKVDSSGCQIGQKVVLSGVHFPLNSAELSPDSSFILDPMVELLRSNPATRIEISGHTDATGSAAYNIKLSTARAESVKRYLLSQGVSRRQLTSRGWGPRQPVASNDSAEGRAKNRRVEFRVLGDRE